MLFLSCLVEPLFRIEVGDLLAVLEEADGCLIGCVIGGVLDAEFVNPQRIFADGQGVADTHLAFGIRREGLPCPADKQEDKTEVHNITAITPRVPERQIHDRLEERFAGSGTSGRCALIEFANDREGHEDRHHNGQPGVKVLDSTEVESNSGRQRNHSGRQEIPFQAVR